MLPRIVVGVVSSICNDEGYVKIKLALAIYSSSAQHMPIISLFLWQRKRTGNGKPARGIVFVRGERGRRPAALAAITRWRAAAAREWRDNRLFALFKLFFDLHALARRIAGSQRKPPWKYLDR